MKRMTLPRCLSSILLCSLMSAAPVTYAQLSSENYRVDGSVVGSESLTVTATSASYQLRYIPGGTYTYDDATTVAPNDGGSGSQTQAQPPPPPSPPQPELVPPAPVPPQSAPDGEAPPSSAPPEGGGSVEGGGDSVGQSGGSGNGNAGSGSAVSRPTDHPVREAAGSAEFGGDGTASPTWKIWATPAREIGNIVRSANHAISSFIHDNAIEIESIEEVARSASTPVSRVGAVTGTALGVASLFNVPFSVTNFGQLLAHSWNNLLAFVVYRRRRREWGTVYDSKSKAPIDPAYVELFTEGGKKVDEAITDLDGRYGFVVPEGRYTMQVRKTNFTFPSKKLAPGAADTLYRNVYVGGTIEVDNAIVHDVPMDPVAFDWNQYEKIRTKQTRYFHWLDPVLVRVLDALFIAGAASVVWQFIMSPSFFTTALLGLYLALITLRLYRGGAVSYGTVYRGGVPLARALIRVIRDGHEIKRKATDEHGRYAVLVTPGTYELQVDARDGEEEYRTVHRVKIESRRGVINKNIRLDQ